MSKIIENKLIEEFKGKESFSKEDLFNFFLLFEPKLKEGTLAWRIYDLKNKDIIKPLRRGVYVISEKPIYKPVLSDEMLTLSKRVHEKFEDVTYCIWDTNWLNEFSQQQFSKKIIIIEIEKDFTESLFYDLKDNLEFDVFLTPNATIMDLYVLESQHPVIIKKLITRSPIQNLTEKKRKVYTPLLEKILVDIFSEDKIFYFYHGEEMVHIYENAIKNYSLNFTRLLSYARRRKKEEEIKSFLKKNVGRLVKNILDD